MKTKMMVVSEMLEDGRAGGEMEFDVRSGALYVLYPLFSFFLFFFFSFLGSLVNSLSVVLGVKMSNIWAMLYLKKV